MIRGNIFKNWDKICYIAPKISAKLDDYGNEINEYGKPVKYSFNIQPAGGNFDITLYGEKINKVYKAVVPYSYNKKIKEGDIVYLDGAEPVGETINGDKGNYFVDSIRPQNIAMTIYFKKIEK